MGNIAIIPARCGSKGVKDKNIKDFCGKPLIAYTIETALKCMCFDEVMVSTDSVLYAKIAKGYGASVPFLRSETMATDTASSWDVVDEVLQRYRSKGMDFETFCLLQPTSPLRTVEDIKAAYELFKMRNASAVVSVCEAEHSPLWCGHLPESAEFTNFIKRESMVQRQSGEKFYRLNGAIYIVDTEYFKKEKFFYQEGSFAYIMPQLRSVDIDTLMDFKFAEILYRETCKENNI